MGNPFFANLGRDSGENAGEASGLWRACVRECSGEHACVITCCKVIGLMDGVGGGPHYLSTRKGHTGTLWGGIGTCTRETHPYSV
jgi:hypothetical protein